MLTLLALLMLSSPAHAQAYEAVPERLAHSEVFAFTDGSSIYTFHADHRFELGPVGMSGRTIEGVWQDVDGGLLVTGTWSWMNGLSVPGDVREMLLNVTPHGGAATKVGIAEVEVQPTYFAVERLQKVAPEVLAERKKAVASPSK